MRMLVWLFSMVSIAASQFPPASKALPEDTLARVGSAVITAKDFLERFELMPWPGKDKKNRIEFTKQEFLYSIVAEKLLALEATAQNLGNDSVALSLQRNYERMFVRDELYKSEILGNISITPRETKEGMLRFPYSMEVEVLGILSKKEGDLLYKKVAGSKNKRKTLNAFRDTLFIPVDTLSVFFGFPDRDIEDAVFAIGKDSLSKPLETKVYGWVMFSLLKRNTIEQNTKLSHPDRLHKVQNIIKQRKEDSLAVRTFASITSPHRAEANPEIFYMLADTVYEMLRRDSAEYFSKGVFQFTGAVQQLAERVSGRAQEQFITIASGGMTLGEVLRGLANNNVVFPSPLNREHTRSVLNNNIKTVIQNELLAREGMNRNLHQSENVRHDLSVWMDNYKSRVLLKNIVDTVKHSADSTQMKKLDNYLQQSVDSYIGTLAKKYGVTINEDALRKTSTTTHSMVTWRFIGFGGRIIAVPPVMRQYEWKYEWQRQEQINQ